MFYELHLLYKLIKLILGTNALNISYPFSYIYVIITNGIHRDFLELKNAKRKHRETFNKKTNEKVTHSPDAGRYFTIGKSGLIYLVRNN